jgi:hypothetical protein
MASHPPAVGIAGQGNIFTWKFEYTKPRKLAHRAQDEKVPLQDIVESIHVEETVKAFLDFYKPRLEPPGYYATLEAFLRLAPEGCDPPTCIMSASDLQKTVLVDDRRRSEDPTVYPRQGLNPHHDWLDCREFWKHIKSKVGVFRSIGA